METKRKIDFRQVRDFGSLINITFEFIRENFKGLALSQLIIAGPAVILLGIMNTLNLLNTFSETVFLRLVIIYVPMFFVFILVMSVAYGYINIYLDTDKTEITPADVWEEVKKNFGMMSATLILSSIWIALASLLLILPGIYLLINFSIVFAIRHREKLSFSDAFSRCTELIKHRWWYTFGLAIVIGIIQAFFTYILQMPSTIAIVLRMTNILQGFSVFNTLLLLITSVIGSFGHLFYSIFCIGMTFYYYTLVEQKEARGLLNKVETINELN